MHTLILRASIEIMICGLLCLSLPFTHAELSVSQHSNCRGFFRLVHGRKFKVLNIVQDTKRGRYGYIQCCHV